MCTWLLMCTDNEYNYCARIPIQIIEGSDNPGSDNRGSIVVATPRKTEKRSSESLQTTSLCLSNAKSTLKVWLTLNKVEKTSLNISIMFILFLPLSVFLSLSSSKGVTRNV